MVTRACYCTLLKRLLCRQKIRRQTDNGETINPHFTPENPFQY
jgi:hypothetical protein